MSVYILSSSRTPFGSLMGSLSTVPATRLGAEAIKGALNKANLSADKVEEVFMGQVIQAGCGQAPARQASLFAGLPESVPAVTVNKVCGSGMQSVILAAKSILTDGVALAIGGGMENMSLAPYLLPHARTGFRFGNIESKDAMQWDGLWDVYSDQAMGNCAEECTKKYQMTREEQDNFSIESFKRAQVAIEKGYLANEIIGVEVRVKREMKVVDTDEGPFKANFDKMKTLKPVFNKEGTITAANASTINDGACALVLGGEEYKDQAKFKILGWASHAQNPTWFTTAPVEAMKKVLQRTGKSLSEIELFEINEAFAAVSLAAIKELELDHQKVNVLGGAVSIGHPIGASGARIIGTLMNAMEINNKKLGMASICIGGGEALAMIIERV